MLKKTTLHNLHLKFATPPAGKIRGIIRDYRKPYLVLLILHVVGIAGVLFANTAANPDEWGRDASGGRNFGYTFGRWISEYLSIFVHTSTALANIRPLTQLLACAICALAALCLIRVIAGTRQFSKWSYAAVIPLALSPYFLPNLAFVYDSPYMALSIFFPIVPLLFRHKKIWIYAIAAFFGNLFMCETYQPSAGIFPMLVILLCYLDWTKGVPLKEIGRFLLVSILAYGTALLLFWILVHLFAHPTGAGGYVNTNIAPNLHTVYWHYRSFFWTLRGDCRRLWKVLIFIIVLLFWILSALSSKHKKAPSLALGAGTLLFMALLQWGVYPFLTFTGNGASIMYGTGAFLAMVGVAAVHCSAKWMGYLPKICTLCLGWCFLVFAALYGNGLKIQTEYMEKREQAVVEDILSLGILEEGVPYAFNVGQGVSGRYAPIFSTNPLYSAGDIFLRDLSYASDAGMSRYRFCYGYGLPFVADGGVTSNGLPLVSDTVLYSIYTDGENVYVYLK